MSLRAAATAASLAAGLTVRRLAQQQQQHHHHHQHQQPDAKKQQPDAQQHQQQQQPPPQQQDAKKPQPDHHQQALIEEAAVLLSRARRVVAFTGAGISAESGIRTYRDSLEGGGLWDGIRGQLGLLLFGTRLGFCCLPRMAWEVYCERLLLPILRAEPNPGHAALAELRCPVITQNVDGLHQRAGSTEVLELHGSCTSHRCAWTGRAVALGPRVDPRSPPARFARPDVVLFFEGMPAAFWRASALAEELGEGDVMLVVGTAAAVAPACTLPYVAMSNGCRVIEVNLERCLEDEPPPPPRPLVVDPDHGPTDPRPFTVYGERRDLRAQQLLLAGRAGTVLPALVARVRELERSASRREAAAEG